jgi:iron complex transport system permease protein
MVEPAPGLNPKLTPKRWVLTLLALLVFLVAAVLASLFFGRPQIGVLDAILDPDNAGRSREMLLKLRLPRVGAGIIVGGSLGICGAVLQALLRNPLAYPHILGISGGAAVGGITARLFGFSVISFGGILLPGGAITAFAAALASTFLVYGLARVRGRLEPVTLILVGVVFNSFAAALILFLFAFADMREARSILFWMVGSLDFVNRHLLGWVVLFSLAGAGYLMTMARALNVLTLGDEVAESLGVPVERTRFTAFVITALVVGSVVSLCGMIGFVGLIIPHIFRLLFGSDHRTLLPASFLGGAIFLVLADLCARSLLAPVQIPVGVLTAFCGGPFFLYLLKRHRGRTLNNG